MGDLRYAVRRLRAAPGFAAIAILTLALGIGATTAIFSAVNPVLFQPLPYPHPDRIAMIVEMRSDRSRNDGTFGMYRELTARSRSFEAMAVFRPWQPTMTGAEQPERFDGQRVSASYFQVLGVAPRIGRGLDAADDRPNGANLVVLSDGLWRRRFAADPGIVGRPITLDDVSYVVAGVMPRGFDNVLAPQAELWTLLQYDISQPRAWGHHLRTVGRLRPGVTGDEATIELSALGRAVLDELHPATYGLDLALVATPLQDEVTRSVRPALVAIFGAVTLLLAIACVNVTNLLLARGVQRRGEFALRAALGAPRRRLIRQLLVESLLIAAAGGLVGTVVAIFGVRALVALSPPDLPRASAINVDRTVFGFAFAVSTLIGLAFGLMPALQAARRDPRADLASGSSRTAGSLNPARRALVVVEVALALVLLVTSGLLLRSINRLFAIDAGFDPSRLLTLQVQTSGRRFDDVSTTTRFFSQALDAVRRVPGVAGAALTSQLPLSADHDEYGVHFESIPEGYSTFRYAVSPGYIETMRIPLRRGRAFTDDDRAGSPLVALINESFANRRFGADDPIGKRLRVGPTDGPPYTIVGVVGDVKQLSLALTEPDAVYLPASQWRFGDNVMSLVVRARGEAVALAPAVREAIWAIDKDQPIVRVATMAQLVAASAAERRFALMLFEAFAIAALLLAAAGIYGVLAGSVAERTREIGIRAALGASRANLVAMIVRQGMMPALIGAVLGVAGAAASSRAIGALLFGISRLDPVTYAAVIVLLAGVSAVACSVPAWRAIRIDPAVTLRRE